MGKYVVSTWIREYSAFEMEPLDSRLVSLAAAVGMTAARVQASNFDSGNLIKGIFVAPEYFFATPGAGSTPSPGFTVPRSLTRGNKKKIMRHMRQLSAQHRRILIVPGSVAWKAPATPNAMQSAARSLMYYLNRHDFSRVSRWSANKAAIQSLFYINHHTRRISLGRMPGHHRLTDGDLARLETNEPDQFRDLLDAVDPNPFEAKGDKTNAIDRLNGGGVNFVMRNTTTVYLNGRPIYHYNKQGNFHEELGDPDTVFIPGGRSGIVELEGIRFGFEICLDHNMGFLRQQLRPNREIDVHLIVSDFVENEGTNVPVRPGGFLIHGSTSPNQNGVWQRTDTGWTEIPQFATDNVGGSELLHHGMDLDVLDPFELAGTVFADALAHDRPPVWEEKPTR